MESQSVVVMPGSKQVRAFVYVSVRSASAPPSRGAADAKGHMASTSKSQMSTQTMLAGAVAVGAVGGLLLGR